MYAASDDFCLAASDKTHILEQLESLTDSIIVSTSHGVA